jgi:S1-C subfamily serine protease
MKRITAAALLGIALACPGMTAAVASVPLPAVEKLGMPSLAPVLKKVSPAVVSILAKGHADAAAPQKRAAKRAGPDHETRSAGSGVVFDARQGLILTNHHVIDKADEILVTLDDGRELRATLVGTDPDTDIAVLRIAADNLTAITFADMDQAEVGDFVLVIGTPIMIGRTVTAGIISGLHRNTVGIEAYEDFIQTDAAIYPGHSGGAMVNLRGELVGIATAFIGATSANPSMGFAIPADMARTVADHLVEFGHNRRGKLGISFEDASPALARELKLAATPTLPLITKVVPGSSADRAGMKVGDMVTMVGEATIRDAADLRTRLGLLWSGEVAELTVERDGEALTIRATLAEAELRAKTK